MTIIKKVDASIEPALNQGVDSPRFVSATLTSALLLLAIPAQGEFSNYNSVLVGDRSSGMGGAFTALTGDPSATAFYNPATLSQLKGTSFEAHATLFNKYDTNYGGAGNLQDSTLKLNQGDFEAIPSAAGTAIGFGTFALGASFITPDYDTFSGDLNLNSYPNNETLITYTDKSLWIGGNLAVNFTERFSAGLTFYYTSRDFNRTTDEQTTSGSNTAFLTESKVYTANNVVYILGFFYKLTDNWNLGLSYRPPAIQLAGKGSYYRALLDTSVGTTPVTYSQKDVQANTHIPQKLSMGISYERPRLFAIDFDASLYGADSYLDLNDPNAADRITYRQIVDYAIGAEYYARSWISIRAGVFTNFSSHPEIAPINLRQGDRIDMLGFSGNVGIYSGQTAFTIGGYFTGGNGNSTQPVAQQFVITPKSTYIYALLLGSSYAF